jgi:hypothetical protein
MTNNLTTSSVLLQDKAYLPVKTTATRAIVSYGDIDNQIINNDIMETTNKTKINPVPIKMKVVRPSSSKLPESSKGFISHHKQKQGGNISYSQNYCRPPQSDSNYMSYSSRHPHHYNNNNRNMNDPTVTALATAIVQAMSNPVAVDSPSQIQNYPYNPIASFYQPQNMPLALSSSLAYPLDYQYPVSANASHSVPPMMHSTVSPNHHLPMNYSQPIPQRYPNSLPAYYNYPGYPYFYGPPPS